MAPKRPRDEPEDATALKRRRQYSERDQKLARIYNELADERNDVRINAAKDFMNEFSAEKNPDGESLEKAFTRLIRGLCSGRKAARFGFFIALSELLRQSYAGGVPLNGLGHVGKLLEQINILTKPEGDVPGQERKDHLFGRVSAYKALLQSTAFLQSEAAQSEHWPNLLDFITALARDTPWLREECCSMLCEFIKTQDPTATKYIHDILPKIVSHDLARTPGGVAIWLCLKSRFPTSPLPEDVWKKNDPLCTKERPNLAKVMCESVSHESDDNKAKKAKSGTWQARPSFAWNIVLQEALKRESKPAKFKQFWIEVVDNALFAAKASAERKLWGFTLFARMIATMPAAMIPAIFSPNLMRCLINHRASEERGLHDAAVEPLKRIRTRIQKEPELASIFLEQLLSAEGSISFDRITKSKTVEEILSSVDGDHLSDVLDLLRRLIIRPSSDGEKEAGVHRQILADLLLSIVREHISEDTEADFKSEKCEWLRQAIQILVQFSYFSPNDHKGDSASTPFPPISSESREKFQSRLSSCFSHLFHKLSDPSPWTHFAVTQINHIKKNQPDQKLVLDADEAILEAVKTSHQTISKLQKKSEKETLEGPSATRAFILLFSLTLLQVYNGDADAVAILDDLQVCYSSLKTSAADSEVFDTLVEVLLTFLSKPGALYRKLAEQVFPSFTSQISATSLESLLEILGKKETVSGQQELFEQAGAEEAEDDEDGSDEQDSSELEIDSDVEMLSTSEATDDDASEKEDSEKEDDDSDDEELTRFNAALATTLKTSLEDDAASDSDGSDMDDEQMMAIDPHLTKIFQERAKLAGGVGSSKKKESKDAKANMVNFKTRVLELLGIYLKKEFARGDVLRVIVPVLECIRTTTSPAVANKANDVLISLYSTCSKQKVLPALSSIKDDKSFKPEDAMGVLKAIHEEVGKPGSKLHDSACSKASLFVAKTLLADDAEAYGFIADVYNKTIKEYFDGDGYKLSLQPTFFTEWISWTFEMRKQKEVKQKLKVEKPISKKEKKGKVAGKEKMKVDAESGARGRRGGKSRNRAGKKAGNKEGKKE
ncbi:hypothetical protein FKW77_009483 [Venturia effusa]|uniref:DNA-directed DNA polymerase n=1 Tax=Venturia effusa TaxID=50376 RepID=A0A517L850_9PEZI|nr:hypothetical protein FKW77_009483 [Venturia effusa]